MKNRNQLARWIRRIAVLSLALVSLAAIVMAWLPKPVPVDSVNVLQGELTITVDEDGRTRVKDRYTVSAPIAGNVARIELKPGAEVESKQVLARIVPVSSPLLDPRSKQQAEAQVLVASAAQRQARAQIDRAEAALEYAKKQVTTRKALVSQGASPQAELDRQELELRSRKAELTSAKFGAKVADHELGMARAALGQVSGGKKDSQQLVVTSPISGRVLKLIQESEGVVQAGSPLVELGDPQALEIVIDVLTSDAVQIKPGAPVRIVAWGGPELRGHVRQIEPSAFTKLSALGVEEQRVNAVIDLDEPYEKWKALMDGYRVEARIIVFQAQSVLKVPASALFRKGDSWAVFAIKDGKAQLSEVSVGRSNGLETEITAGLEAGTVVIPHPSDRVTDGASVSTR
ncbi:MAG: efflux RND transporter periplasmic adaptor subunit [Polyangiaceae bacterium]